MSHMRNKLFTVRASTHPHYEAYAFDTQSRRSIRVNVRELSEEEILHFATLGLTHAMRNAGQLQGAGWYDKINELVQELRFKPL